MNVARVAGVDPHMQSVAIFESRLTAPRNLLLALNVRLEEQGILPNGDADLGKFFVARQFGTQAWQNGLIGQRFRAIRKGPVQSRGFQLEPHEHAGVNQGCFICRVHNSVVLLFALRAFLAKEMCQYGPAVFRHDACRHVATMIQAWVVQQPVQ